MVCSKKRDLPANSNQSSVNGKNDLIQRRENNDDESDIDQIELASPTVANQERSLSNASALHLIKKGTKLQVIRGFIADYSNATSIHGIKYFGARKKRWYERLIWFTLVCASMYFCIKLTIQTWNNWYNNPVIVSLAESSTPIWEIPFPAVTICPLVKYKRDYKFKLFLEQIDEVSSNFTEDELHTVNAISNVCLINSNDFKNINFSDYFAGLLKYGDLKMLKSLAEVAPNENDTFEAVKWRDIDLKSDNDAIKTTITGDGLCFSFNTLDDSMIFRNNKRKLKKTSNQKSNWSLEEGYPPKSGTNVFPRRVLAGDNDESFHVMLKSRLKDNDPECSGKSEGYKVILHTPDEYPQVSKRFFLVPFSQIVSVSVKPNMITTSPVVRNYAPEKRQCFFNNERYLKYFKIYTQGNCEHECLSNATLKACGCVKFSQQKDASTRYCGAAKIKCYQDARKMLLRNDDYKKVCNCMPACTSVAYDAEVTQSVLNEVVDENNSTDREIEKIAQSTMKVFFGSNQFLSAKRSELYGIADLIANIGGLFGMFMGTSILSLVEIIYFCTVRMYVNMKLRQKNKEKEALEENDVNV